MRVAFYAPLKPPDSPIPSGDRRLARLFLSALRRGGHQVEIASRLRAFEGQGDTAEQEKIRRRAARTVQRLIARHRQNPPEIWFTYHLYYKAPDWIGPSVCRELSIPYVVAEASLAPKRKGGPWHNGHCAVQAAVRQAAQILVLNPDDRECLAPQLSDPASLVAMPPFIDTGKPRRSHSERGNNRARIAAQYRLDGARTWIAVTAMMRPGDKLESYRILGRSLTQLAELPLHWLVAGDGPARPAVETALGSENVTFLGTLENAAVDALHSAADLFVWPAYREAFGMALLEAQAAGLPVIAGASPGVAQIVDNGKTGLLCPVGDDTMLADAIRRLAMDADLRNAMGQAAMHKAQTRHDIAQAAETLDGVLRSAAGYS